MQSRPKLDRILSMRIGIFDPYLNDLGGGEKYMMTIAQCLSQKHRVEVFWNERKDLEKLVDRFSLDISKINIVGNIFSSKTSTFKRFIKTREYDAIFVLSDGSIPVVSSKLFIHFQQPLSNLKTSFKLNLKKQRINSIFCNSFYTKSYIDRQLGVNSLVIYPPVEIKSRDLKKENIILNVGRFRIKDARTVGNGLDSPISDYKKQGVMINVFKKMVKKGLKGWKLVIATSVNDNEKAIFENFKKNAEDFPIEFLVNKKNDDLWDIYSKAKIYWHASGFGEDLDEHPEFAEHFGISTVEAMGAGAVPVVINAGGQKEIVEDGKNGFLWDNLEELESKTFLLIENEKKLNEMSKKAKIAAEKFAADNFCNKIYKLIQ